MSVGSTVPMEAPCLVHCVGEGVEKEEPGGSPSPSQEALWSPSLLATSETTFPTALILTAAISTCLTIAKFIVVGRITSNLKETQIGMFNMVIAICLLASGNFS